MSTVDISPATAVWHLQRYAPRTRSIVYADRTWTAEQVAEQAGRIAGVLAAGGVRRGDRVAYLGMNSASFMFTYLACAHLGVIFVPLNFRLAAGEVAHVLADCGAHTVVAEDGHRAVGDAVAPKVHVRRWLLIDDDPAVPVEGRPDARWEPLSPLVAEAVIPGEPIACQADDTSVLMYTSGTTGRAKGVVLTYGNVWWNAVNVDSVVDTRRDDVNLAVAPLFHIGGLNAYTVRALVRGGTVVIQRAFDPVETLRALVEHRVTTMFAVPAMYAALTRAPGFAEADLSAFRGALVAGAPVPPSLIAEYAERGVLLQQAWGLTETSPFATYLPAERTVEKMGSAGAPMPYTRIKLVEPYTGRPITEPNVRGEICVKGPNVTPGYWNNPAATAEAFDAGGWFHSGDIGYLDEDGYLYIVDRLKDMIISGGENVYPAEVERVLVTMPGVLDAAVIGAPDEKWGETVVAILACEAGCEPTVEEVRAFAADHLARYKLPTRVMTVTEMPRNGSGKLDKVRLRNLSQAATP